MIWITRGTNMKLNRNTGQVAQGDFASRTTGADGLSNSAIKFDTTDHLEMLMVRELTGDFTIQLGYKK